MEDPSLPAGSEMFSLVSSLKKELAGMFQSLEKSMKKKMTALRLDMYHLLARVEKMEKNKDTHEVTIKELQDTVTQLAFAHH